MYHAMYNMNQGANDLDPFPAFVEEAVVGMHGYRRAANQGNNHPVITPNMRAAGAANAFFGTKTAQYSGIDHGNRMCGVNRGVSMLNPPLERRMFLDNAMPSSNYYGQNSTSYQALAEATCLPHPFVSNPVYPQQNTQWQIPGQGSFMLQDMQGMQDMHNTQGPTHTHTQPPQPQMDQMAPQQPATVPKEPPHVIEAPKKKRKSQDPEKPSRPCSSYNYFYKRERERILWEHGLIDGEKLVQGKRRLKYGVMSFQEMARAIAQRWKEVNRENGEEIRECQRLAHEDKMRYQREVKEYRRRELDAALKKQRAS